MRERKGRRERERERGTQMVKKERKKEMKCCVDGLAGQTDEWTNGRERKTHIQELPERQI